MKFSVSLLSVRILVAADPGIQKFVTDFYPPASQESCSEFSFPSFVHLPLCSPVYIKDFKIVDYGRLRRLDAYSVDWVEYGKMARKFAACCHLRSPSDGRR